MFTVTDILRGRVKTISDTHFGHHAITYMSSRPGHDRGDHFYHNQLMRNNWFASVDENDYVLHLGDVAKSPEDIEKYCADLPGNVIVVPGNHDSKKHREAMREIGWKVHEAFSIVMPDYTAWFCHKPMGIRKRDVAETVQINVHGHQHTHEAPTPQHINLSVERPEINYCPKDLLPIMNMTYERALSAPNGGRGMFDLSKREFPPIYHPAAS